MASLTGQLVAETYKALLKTIDNDILTASEKQITDGLGGGSNVFIDSQGFLRANKYKVTNGLATQFLKADGSLDANTYLTSITSSQIITALGYTPVTNARTLTINGTTYDLSANRSWTVAGTAAIWGNITGTLSDQTDLQTALNAKYNNPTGTTSQYIRGDGTIANFPAVTGFVPYTGATEDVDLGTHTLLARDLVIDHASASGTAVDITKGGSGIAVNIEKSGSGEALTVVKSSGSGNAASITGGTTLISELHLTTKLADAYISSAATWNAKQNQLNGTGFVKASGTTISYDNSTYLTTADAALTYLALTGGTLTGSITATSFIKTGGTSNEYLRADGSVNVITGDIISGSGTAGYIAKFGSSAVIASSNLFESGANIGFGTITLNYGSYGRAFTGAGFGSTSFGFEAVTGSTTNGGLIGGLSLVIAGNDSTRRIGSAIQSYISGATSTHQGADLRFFVKPDNAVLLEVVRMTSAGITFNKDLTAANINATTFVKSGGTASEFLMADGSVSTYTNPVTGTGSAGYIPKWTSASNLGQSFMYDDGTSIGIAYTTPNRGGYGRALSGASFGSASFGFEAVSNTTTNGGLIGGLSFIVNQNDSSRIVGSAIQSNLVGTTATNYGADLRFFAKADGVFTIAEVARMTSAGLRVYGTIVKDGGTGSQYLMADGSVSTLTGVVTGSGTTNYIPKWTSGSAIGNSTLQNDANGNLGLGLTPSAWFTNVNIKALELGYKGNAIYGVGGSDMRVLSNAYYDGVYRYADAGQAAVYQLTDGNHRWFNAPTGTANASVTMTQAMTLFLSGNLGIGVGNTDAGFKLDVNGTSRFTGTLNGLNSEFSNTISAFSGELILESVATNNSWLGNNFYFADGLFKYKRNGFAQAVYFDGADFEIRVADTGIANNNVSWKTGLRIYSASGNLETPQDFTANKLIKSGGTSAQFLKADGSIDSSTYLTTAGAAAQYQPIGSYATGSGEATRLARWTSTTNLSVAQIWDDGTNIGIGQAPGAFKLDVTGTGRFTGNINVGNAITATNVKLIFNGVVNKAAGIEFQQSGSAQWYIGNGIASEDNNFELYNSNGTMAMKIIKSTNNINFIGTTTFSNIVTSNTQFRVLASGNFRINNNVDGLIGYLIRSGAWKGTAENNIALATDGPYGVSFFTNGTGAERFHITSGGNIVINNGTTDSGFRFDVNGTGRFSSTLTMGSWEAYTFAINNAWLAENVVFEGGFKRRTTGYAIALYSDAASGFQVRMANTGSAGSAIAWTNAMALNGSSFAATFASSVTATSFFESSDFRLKKLIEHNPIIEGIENLQAKLYEKNGKIELGYFAQDAEIFMPYAVSKNADGFLNLSYREVHTAKIARLEKEVAELKAKLNAA
jgi:hypothetical protein